MVVVDMLRSPDGEEMVALSCYMVLAFKVCPSLTIALPPESHKGTHDVWPCDARCRALITDPYFYAVTIPAVLLLGISKS
jgi:hypothetical protein